MKKVVVASGVRTPIGDFGGSLQPAKPLDLMMTVMILRILAGYP